MKKKKRTSRSMAHEALDLMHRMNTGARDIRYA
jgi:hypothetical protein